MKVLRNFLDSITMYRLLLYGLIAITVVAFVFSLTGVLTLVTSALALSLVALISSSYITQKIATIIWHPFNNQESWLLTALILFFVLAPVNSGARFGATFLAGVLAILSKYLIAWKGKHIFNPAAFAVVLVSLVFGLTYASWWVGSSLLMPFTALLGILITLKLRHYALMISFTLASLVALVVVATQDSTQLGEALSQMLLSSPFIFFGGVMLTEPATRPIKQWQQIIFGALVGFFAVLQPHLGSIRISTELALVLGNLGAFLVNPKFQARLTFNRIEKLSKQSYALFFTTKKQFAYEAGQYMQWTLPHKHTDDRGNRRSFTIASSPEEKEIQIAIKLPMRASSYKKALIDLKLGDTVLASQLSGTFTLPKDASQKLLFIAGGVGITPFRSMIAHLYETQQTRDIILIHKVNSAHDADYAQYFKGVANSIGLTYLVMDDTASDWLERSLKDYKDSQERKCYLSGPSGMVRYTQSLLIKKGIHRSNIKTDYFSGY